MKHLLVALFFGFQLVGCVGHPMHDKERIELSQTAEVVNGYSLMVIVFDGCQYVVSGSGNAQMITHKGNCNNPIHYSFKELKEEGRRRLIAPIHDSLPAGNFGNIQLNH